MEPKVSIVIVTWNTLLLFKKCLDSIDKQADVPYELFLIDNGSIDKTPDFMKDYKPQNNNCVHMECLYNDEDYGLAVAANKGFRKARGEYLLLLNPDMEMFPQTLSKLAALGGQYPKMGAMGVKLLNSDGSIQHCVSRYPTIFSIVAGRLKMGKIFPSSDFIKKRLEAKFDDIKESVVDHVKGALFFMRREAMEKINFFDEGFFLWFEETDVCKRLNKIGYEIMYTPDVSITHQGGAAMVEMSFWERQSIYNKSLRRYFRKHYGIVYSLLAGILDPVCTVIAMIIYRK